MSGTQVIKAIQMFTKNGRSKQISLLREIGTGLTLGLAAGLVWKVRHLPNVLNQHGCPPTFSFGHPPTCS